MTNKKQKTVLMVIDGQNLVMNVKTYNFVKGMIEKESYLIEDLKSLADTIEKYYPDHFNKCLQDMTETGKAYSPANIAIDILTEMGQLLQEARDRKEAPKTGIFLPDHLVKNPKGKIILPGY